MFSFVLLFRAYITYNSNLVTVDSTITTLDNASENLYKLLILFNLEVEKENVSRNALIHTVRWQYNF